MTFITLTEDQERELYRLYRLYWREARRCEKSKAYLAGCVMLGSALETLLMLMINVYPDEAIGSGKAPARKHHRKPLLEWNLGELLRVAKAVGWLPSALDISKDEWSSRKAKVGDYAELSRHIRNLIHPGRYAEDHYRKRITAKYLEQQFDVVQGCQDWPAFPDPADSARDAVAESDEVHETGSPDMQALSSTLQEWWVCEGDRFAPGELLEAPDIREVLAARVGFEPTAASVGRWLRSFDGRIVQGLRLRK